MIVNQAKGRNSTAQKFYASQQIKGMKMLDNVAEEIEIIQNGYINNKENFSSNNNDNNLLEISSK